MQAFLLEIGIMFLLIVTGWARQHWKLLLVAGLIIFFYGVYMLNDTASKVATGILAALSFVTLGVTFWIKFLIVAASIIASNFVHGFLGNGLDKFTDWIPRNPDKTGLNADLNHK